MIEMKKAFGNAIIKQLHYACKQNFLAKKFKMAETLETK